MVQAVTSQHELMDVVFSGDSVSIFMSSFVYREVLEKANQPGSRALISPQKREIVIIQKLAKLFTPQSRQPIQHLCLYHFFSIQAQCVHGTWCSLFLTGTLTSAGSVRDSQGGLTGEVQAVRHVMGSPNSCLVNQQRRAASLELPGHLVSSTVRDAGQGRSWGGDFGFHCHPCSAGPGSAGAIQQCRMWLDAGVRWPKELGRVTLEHNSPAGVDLMLGCLGIWKRLVDFCHFASPSCGNYCHWTVVKLSGVVSFNQQPIIFYSGYTGTNIFRKLVFICFSEQGRNYILQCCDTIGTRTSKALQLLCSTEKAACSALLFSILILSSYI